MDLGPSLAPPTVLSFDGNISDAWTIWKQEFLLYLDATETSSKPDKVKSSILLSCIGKRGREIYNTFTFAEGDNMKTSKILEQFDQYCLPQKNLTFLRYNFFTYRQKEGETFDEFTTQLRKLSHDCEFSTLQDSLVKDMIIIGTNDKALQERLLRDPEMDLLKAIRHGQAAELTRKHAKALQSDSSIKTAAAITRKKYIPTPGKKSSKEVIKKCKFCSYSHARGSCSAFNKKCNNCHQKGHFSKCCPKQNLHDIHSDMANIPHADNNDNEEFFVGTITAQELQKDNNTYQQPISYNIDLIDDNEWHIQLETNGIDISYKIDSGSQVNVLPKFLYYKMQKRPKLHMTNVKLSAYNGSSIPILGQSIFHLLLKKKDSSILCHC